MPLLDEDLDQRLRVRRDPARVRQERHQARRGLHRPRPAAPAAAVRVRPDDQRLPGPGEAARRRQGPRDRCEQLPARAPRADARRHDSHAGRQPDRAAPLLPAEGHAGPARPARDPDPGLVPDRWHHVLHPGPDEHSGRRHAAGDRRAARQVPGAGDGLLAPPGRPLGDPQVDQDRAHRRELRRLRLRAHDRRARRDRRPRHRRARWPPVEAITREAYAFEIPEA